MKVMFNVNSYDSDGDVIDTCIDLFLNETTIIRLKNMAELTSVIDQLNKAMREIEETFSRYEIMNEPSPDVEVKECVWTPMEECDVENWETSCGDTFTTLNGTPSENAMKYCPFCGLKIRESYERKPIKVEGE